MSTFLSSFQSRFSNQLRTNWSNGQLSTATTPNTTLEGLADTDTVGEFKKRGITPDSTLDTHVTTAMAGIISRLMFYVQAPGWEVAWQMFQDDLKLLAETTSRDRMTPSNDSLLLPTTDTSGDKPPFDSTEFKGYVTKGPNQPNGASPPDNND